MTQRQASSSTFYNQIDVEVKQTLIVNAYRLLSKSKGETKQENMLSGHQDMNFVYLFIPIILMLNLDKKF
jgi:hypothetical protein